MFQMQNNKKMNKGRQKKSGQRDYAAFLNYYFLAKMSVLLHEQCGHIIHCEMADKARENSISIERIDKNSLI